MTMLERLFSHDNLDYEVELPEDPSQWTEQINGILFTKYPDLANFPTKLMLDKFEPQKLYAKGSYVIDVNKTIVTIPVIVKSKRLQPLDTALINNKWHYLTNELLTELINGNMSLGESMSNKDSVDFYSQPIENDVPYGNYDRNIRTVTASVINSREKSDLALAIMSDKAVKTACEKNAAFKNTLIKILSEQPGKDRKYKSAFVTRDGFLNGNIYVTHADGRRDKLSASFSEAKNFVKKYMPESYVDFIKTGSVSLLDDSSELSGHSIDGIGGIGQLIKKMLGKVSGPGMFSMLGDSGSKPVLVIKIKRVSKPGVGDSDLLGLSQGGLMHDISDKEGAPCDVNADEITNSFENLSPEAIKSDDEIIPVANDEYLEPIKVTKIIELPIGKAIIGETKQTQDTFVGLILSKFNKDKTASDYTKLLPKNANITILPQDTKFIKVSSKHDINFYGSAKECLAAACKDSEFIKVIARDSNTFAIKTASENILCEKICLPYYLNSFGVPTKEIAKTAQALQSTNIVTLAVPKVKKVKLSSAVKNKISDISWIKIAGLLDSEESVDSALALDYLDDGSISEFYSKVPEYKNALSELSKLLISVRLGNEIVNEETVKNAIEALSDLVSELTLNRAGV